MQYQLNIQDTCPHCATKLVSFQMLGYNAIQADKCEYSIFMRCAHCGETIITVWYSPSIYNLCLNLQSGSKILRKYPATKDVVAPENCPDAVANFYRQGTDSLMARNFDASGAMFRKCLETALKYLDPQGKGKLYDRINNLPAEKGVTSAMKDWAQSIRDLGNDAVHEEDPFQESEAKELQKFTEVFLTYAFTLPAMVEARRNENS